jgi:glycosyltransferase involved in cell wall biosynthesis
MESTSCTESGQRRKPLISFGIIAWNEEASIGVTLQSLFRQNIFEKLAARGDRIEVFVLANDCTDQTVPIARDVFEQHTRAHPFGDAFTCRVVEYAERGKLITWNRFVHEVSSPSSQYLVLCDADIVLLAPGTLWNMYTALENDAKASISSDVPIKDVAVQQHRTFFERLSLAASATTHLGEAQVTGQLYCIRASVARNIYLPADLGACDDGFIKNLVCTYFLTRELSPKKVVVPPDASHIFQAYVSPRDVLNNQKRQMLSQAVVHLLIDKHLPKLPLDQKLNMAQTIRAWEMADPQWLRKLICEHARRTRWPWQLVPNILTFRFKRLRKLPVWRRLIYFPSALVWTIIGLIACTRALLAMRKGNLDYWPHTESHKLKDLPVVKGNMTVPLPKTPMLNSGVKP